MKKILLLLTLLITFSGFSQSLWKKQADLRKRNQIKETTVYIQNLKKKNKKRIWDWDSYDKEGRLIESKRFLKNGKLKTHYKFEYPNNKTRILIELDKRGNEVEKREQMFDLSGEKEPLIEKSKSGLFRYEYDENGNTTKVWNIRSNPEELQTEVFFNEDNLRVKEKLLISNRENKPTYILTRTYERDENGNILKITSEAKGKIENIEVHEHKKYTN